MDRIGNIIVTGIELPIVVHLEKDKRVNMTSRRCYGLSFCSCGQITYAMNGKTFVSHAQSAVILPKDGTYTLVCNEEGFFPVINFNCENFNCAEITVIPLKNPQTYLRDFETIKKLFLRRNSRLAILSVFYKILDALASEGTLDANLLAPVVRYIENNISDQTLSNASLAKILGISEVYLRKLFMKQYKTTPKQLILDIRIQTAKQMLVGTPLSVIAIAEKCGFSNPYHFCRIFKQRTELTPTQYRTRNSVSEI